MGLLLYNGTLSKRAEKKQDTHATPERMKLKQAEMMDIDSDEDGGTKVPPSTPPSLNKGDEKGVTRTAAGETSDKVIECGLTPEHQGETPQSIPECQGEKKQGKKGSPQRKKSGPKIKLSNKEKEALFKWLQEAYMKETIYGEDDSLHDDEKKVKKTLRTSRDAQISSNTRSLRFYIRLVGGVFI